MCLAAKFEPRRLTNEFQVSLLSRQPSTAPCRGRRALWAQGSNIMSSDMVGGVGCWRTSSKTRVVVNAWGLSTFPYSGNSI